MRSAYPHSVSSTGPKTNARSQVTDPKSLFLGILTYIMWGFFPLYFYALSPAGSIEVIVHRAFWGLISCIVVIGVFSRWNLLRAVLKDSEVRWRLVVAGILIVVNWTTYVYAVQSGHTIDAALGYFINPLVTVALARVVLKERLSPAQVVAIGLGVLAVIVMVVGLGRLPWVSLVLAFAFGFYSLVKKEIASRVPPLEGMAVETATVTPILLGYYLFLVVTGQTSFHALALSGNGGSTQWIWHLALLIGAGILTMVPLLLFARAARGLPLAVLGLLQYIGPSLQLIIGILVFHETMEPARWIATGIIWLALLVLSGSGIRQIARGRR